MQLDFKTVGTAIVVGLVIVIGFVFLTGREFATPLFPFMAILSGFIIMGIVTGFLSEGETIIEPGIAAIAVSVIAFGVIGPLELRSFTGSEPAVYNTNMLLVMLNGILLTFVGAWAGEKLQGTFEVPSETNVEYLEWGWMLCGAIMGLSVSLVLANLTIILLGFYAKYLFVSLIIGLVLTGYVTGLKSPGITIREAAVAGFLTTVLEIDIFKITLDTDTSYLTARYVFGLTALGLIAALIGGYLGEKKQGTT